MLLLIATACTPMAEGVQGAGRFSSKLVSDTKNSWQNLFTYNPPGGNTALPQTRYCYQMQTDVVCYDSHQPGLRSKLVGYQDGESISWVQPGGGSLGVSGGEPTAVDRAIQVHVAPSYAAAAETYSTGVTPDINAAPVVDINGAMGSETVAVSATQAPPVIPVVAPGKPVRK